MFIIFSFQINIHKCRFSVISRQSFFLNTKLFNFTENEVEWVETGGIFINANRVIFSKNIFHHLNYGALFKISLGKKKFLIKQHFCNFEFLIFTIFFLNFEYIDKVSDTGQ